MKKFSRRKRKRGIWFLFSFLESPRFSLPMKIRMKNELSKREKKETESHERKKI
jgi:hypothetical protein